LRQVVSGSAIVVVACLLLVAAASESDEPMTVETVVQLYVTGTPTDELIGMINAAPVNFDLSQGMIAELERVGLPPELLEAMQQRQAAAASDAVDDDACAETVVASTLTVRLNPKQTRPNRRRIRVHDEVRSDLALEWGLGNDPEDRRFLDVALFLACRCPQHVPDQWRSKTPLRWDAEVMPRHRMLAFAPGARWTEAGFLEAFGITPSRANEEVGPEGREDLGVLVLQIPPTLEAEVGIDEPHDLVVGIALQVRDSYYPWSISALDDVSVDVSGTLLEATIRGTRSMTLEKIAIGFASEDARNAKTLVTRGCCNKQAS
jgi:hypothetical protein